MIFGGVTGFDDVALCCACAVETAAATAVATEFLRKERRLSAWSDIEPRVGFAVIACQGRVICESGLC